MSADVKKNVAQIEIPAGETAESFLAKISGALQVSTKFDLQKKKDKANMDATTEIRKLHAAEYKGLVNKYRKAAGVPLLKD